MRNKGAVRNKEISFCESQKSRHWCQRQQQFQVVVCTLCNTINTGSSDLALTLVSNICQALCSNSLCILCIEISGFTDGSDSKESASNGRRTGFDPWVGKIPWRREWQPTPVFLPGKFHGQRSLAGYSPWYHKELNMIA